MADMQCYHRNETAPQKETYNHVCILNEDTHNYAWETAMLGLLPKTMMGLPLTLLFMISVVFAVTDSKAEYKGKTKETLH